MATSKKIMAQIKNIVEEEEMRNRDGVIPEIHLYQEGEFLRALSE